jgi:REP element-mobilizing transposase RayT
VFSLKYHLVWCPKCRKRILVDTLEKRLRQLLYQKAKEIKAEIHTLEIMPDHEILVTSPSHKSDGFSTHACAKCRYVTG